MHRFSIKAIRWSGLLRLMAVLVASSAAVTVTAPSVSWADSSATRTIAIGSTPTSLAVDPTTATGYTADTLSKAISVISLAKDRVTANIALSINPIVLAIDPTTDTVYVEGHNSVLAINGATDKVVHTIHAHLFGGGIAIDPTTDTVYVE
ncbi:YncE family protein, partial [Ferrimicrobium acidiphilum]|uniref:YncE family protein n=1 Tax=Ferrimicrobium acidiphilum TaxID=121039 RepID=UPI001F2A3AB0